MIIDEVKATLAMEDIVLTKDEEKLIRDYADGRLDMAQLRKAVECLNKKREAA